MKYKIGFIGEIRIKNNSHAKRGVYKGALFEIIGYNNPGSHYPYIVKFLGTKFEALNLDGPFLKDSDIKDKKFSNKAIKILFGDKNEN